MPPESRSPSAPAPSAVCVVIPTFNASRFLGEALASVLSQTAPPASVLVVDDASTDDTVRVAERFAAEGHPVRSIALPTNGGPGTARNVALREADEPLVAFLDADDVWLPDHCRTLVGLLDRYPDAVLAYSRTAPLEGDRSAAGPSEAGLAASDAARPEDPQPHLFFANPIIQSAVMARRAAVLAAGAYTEGMRYSEDYDLWLRLGLEGPFIASPAVGCLRRRHDGQESWKARARMYRGMWEGRRRYLDAARERGIGMAPDEYPAVCAPIYDDGLRQAWQTRDRQLVQDVLDLAPIVPGGAPVAQAWRRRLRLLWPVWRVGTWVWDSQPAVMRDAVRRLRRSGAARGPR